MLQCHKTSFELNDYIIQLHQVCINVDQRLFT